MGGRNPRDLIDRNLPDLLEDPRMGYIGSRSHSEYILGNVVAGKDGVGVSDHHLFRRQLYKAQAMQIQTPCEFMQIQTASEFMQIRQSSCTVACTTAQREFMRSCLHANSCTAAYMRLCTAAYTANLCEFMRIHALRSIFLKHSISSHRSQQ